MKNIYAPIYLLPTAVGLKFEGLGILDICHIENSQGRDQYWTGYPGISLCGISRITRDNTGDIPVSARFETGGPSYAHLCMLSIAAECSWKLHYSLAAAAP